MSKTTKLVKSKVRIGQWNTIFRDQANSGLSVKDYCQSHDISTNKYYYWLRKSQESIVESQQVEQFAEIIPSRKSDITHGSTAAIVIGNVHIEIKENISDAFLRKIIGVIADVV